MREYDVIILGGGIIGLSLAYELVENGFRTVVVERSKIGLSASGYNAGYIVPSMYIPFNLSISLKNIFKWLFKKDSPVKIRLSSDNIIWLIKTFKYRETNTDSRWIRFLNRAYKSVERFEEVIRSLGCECEFRETKMYEIYGDADELIDSKRLYESINPLKKYIRFLSGKEVQEILKVKSDSIAGGFEHLGDYIIDPYKYIDALKKYLINHNVKIYEDLSSYNLELGREIKMPNLNVKANYLAITIGPWINKFSNVIGVKLPIIPVAGYKAILDDVDLEYPVFIEDTKIALTPYREHVSMAGVFDIKGFVDEIDMNRVRRLLRNSSKLIPPLSKSRLASIVVKFRPCSPDEIPIIGRSRNYSNVIFSSGHCRFGLTFSLYTAEELMKMILSQDYTPDYQVIDRFK